MRESPLGAENRGATFRRGPCDAEHGQTENHRPWFGRPPNEMPLSNWAAIHNRGDRRRLLTPLNGKKRPRLTHGLLRSLIEGRGSVATLHRYDPDPQSDSYAPRSLSGAGRFAPISSAKVSGHAQRKGTAVLIGARRLTPARSADFTPGVSLPSSGTASAFHHYHL